MLIEHSSMLKYIIQEDLNHYHILGCVFMSNTFGIHYIENKQVTKSIKWVAYCTRAQLYKIVYYQITKVSNTTETPHHLGRLPTPLHNVWVSNAVPYHVMDTRYHTILAKNWNMSSTGIQNLGWNLGWDYLQHCPQTMVVLQLKSLPQK